MNGNGLEKIQEVVMSWSDWATMVLPLLLLAAILFFFGIRRLNKSDNKVAQWTREVTCGMHSWGYKDCDGKEIMYCTKCGKIPG